MGPRPPSNRSCLRVMDILGETAVKFIHMHPMLFLQHDYTFAKLQETRVELFF